MNIAIFTNNYLPNPYGVSTSIETFRYDFEKMGHKVYVFAPEWPGYKDTNENVFRYPSWDIEFKIKFPLAIPYSRRISKILKNLDIDIIHSQHPNLLGSAAMKWARKKNVPLVFTWHTLYDHYTHFFPLLPKKLAVKYIVRTAVNYANKSDAVIAPTDSIVPILRGWGVKKEIISISTGVVEKEFQGADGNVIREKYGINENDIVLLLASRLTCEKNVLFVVNSVKNILKENENVKLLTIGGGYLATDIVKIAEREGIINRVFLAGEITHDEVKNYFSASDIFIYGSKSETQGMFSMEAMYMGLPVVAVLATGTNSLVLNNGNGFLVSEEEKEFSEAVLKLVNDKDLREKFSEVSKRIARTNFTSEICAKKMLEVYENCLSHR